MSGKVTMSWTDWRGKEQIREFNQIIDVRDFLGTPGYSMLLVAANTDKAAPDIELFLDMVSRKSEETQWVGRPLSWIKRRRWMFQKPGADNRKFAPSDMDGKQRRAVTLMSGNPKLSVRALQRLLKQNGIDRSPEWVRQHRCDVCK